MSKILPIDFGTVKVPILIALVALLVRVLLITWMPDAYQFDAYQRWAGREHLYIQVWLPATQTLVWLVGKLGGTPVVLRLVFSMLGAITIGMIVQLALSMQDSLGDSTDEVKQIKKHHWFWFSLPFVVFGPYVVWSSVPYQESTLLFFLVGGLLLHRVKPEWGDLFIGALALVRYEGWPLIVVHWLLRRKLRAVLLSSWGIIAWLSIKHFGLLTPYMASPDSFSDWNELSANLNPRKARHLARQLWLMFDSSAAGWFLLAATPMLMKWRKWDYRHWMLFWAFLGQCAALIGWLFSLGIAFSRMMVLPVMIIAPLSILGLQWSWTRWNDKPLKRNVFCVAIFVVSCWTIRDIFIDITSFNKHNRWERALVKEINQCKGDVWSIYPRTHNGPRSRHDGCEVIQGLTNLKAGEDFSCVPWGWGGPMATIVATWDDDGNTYEVDRVGGEPTSLCPY